MSSRTFILIHQTPIYPPMAALYLCDALEKSGIRCEIFPCGTPSEKIAVAIEKLDPIAVGMSVITSQEIPIFVDRSKFIKKLFPKLPVIWGGIHPSLNCAQCAKEDYIDHIITGQGEITLPQTVLKLEAGEKPGKIIKGTPVKNMDAYAPRWDKIDITKFIFPEEYSVHSPDKIEYDLNGHKSKSNIFYYLVTSRGCVYNCTFCSEPLGAINMTEDGKRNWKCHSFEWVKSQITHIKETLKRRWISLDGIGIWDDMFWTDMERAENILDYLKSKNLGYFIEARADQLLKDDARLLKKLSDTGCIQVFVGAESADQTTLNYLRKGTKFTDYIRLVELGELYHVAVRLSLIVGFPGETDESVNKTLDFCEEVTLRRKFASISGPKMFTPYPGTVEFERAVARGLVVPADTIQWGGIHRKSEEYMKLYPWLSENLTERTLARMAGLFGKSSKETKVKEAASN